MRHKKNDVAINVVYPRDLGRWVEKKARDEGISRADIMRRIVRQARENEMTKQTEAI